jgi:hypothetical protein
LEARARWAQENPGILDDQEMIGDGPDSPRDLDNPFKGIPKEFLPKRLTRYWKAWERESRSWRFSES